MAIVQNPFPQWQDPMRGGRTIFSGRIFVGQPDTDPTAPANQLQVFYVDENEQQINLSQPLITNSNGYVVISDTNSTIVQPRVAESNYSVTAQNKQSVNLWVIPNAAELTSDIEHNNTISRNAIGAHDAIYIRELTSTQILTDEELGAAPVGTRYRVTNLANARYDVVAETDTGGFYFGTTINGKKIRLMEDFTRVNPVWFGLVYDGDELAPTDNKAVIDAMFTFFTYTYVQPFGGVIEFDGSEGKVFATSGEHSLPHMEIKGNNVQVRSLNANATLFFLDLRFGVQNGRFLRSWAFGGFVGWTDRGFTETTGLDCDHILQIRGGWLIRSRIYNIECLPGFSCRSLVDWDLTHTELPAITEVGVPDGIEFKNISAQYALNTSYAISFSGDQLGTGSRASSIRFTDIYNSITFPKDFETRGNSTNDFGVIRLDNTRLGRCEFSEIFGPQPIRQFADSVISASEFNRVYTELNNPIVNDFESILRSGTYNRCTFHNINLFSNNSNLNAPPRFFFATFTNCRFINLSSNLQSQLTNAPDANFINLGAASSGNVIENAPTISLGLPVSTATIASLPYVLRRMTVNNDTQLRFCERRQISTTAVQTFNANGTYRIATIPESLTEINANCRVTFQVAFGLSAYNADLQLQMAGGGITVPRTSAIRNFEGTAGAVGGEVEFIGRTDLVPNPDPDQFSTNAVLTFRMFGGLSYDRLNGDGGATDRGRPYNVINNDQGLNIQRGSGDYEINLLVTNLSGTTENSLILKAVVEYGYSTEYVNIV